MEDDVVQPAESNKAAFVKRRWLIIAGVLFVTAVLVYVASGLLFAKSINAPQKVSDKFLDQCVSGQALQAYGDTDRVFKSALGADEFQQYCASIAKNIQSQPKMYDRFLLVTGSSPSAAAFVYQAPAIKNSKAIHGPTLYIKVKTIKEETDDKWRVVRIFIDTKKLSTSLEDQ